MEKSESQKIVEKIKIEKITPKSKWQLGWKNYLFWTLWSLMLLLGALFASLTIFNFMDIHPGFFQYLGIGKIVHWLVVTAPFFWILLLAGALIFGLLAFRKTKHGYRYSLLFVTSLTVLIVSSLGITLHFSRVNDRLKEGFFPRESGIGKMAFPIEDRWREPEEGFLAGEIEEMGENNFLLRTLDDDIWTIYFSNKTKVVKKVILEKDSNVGVIGQKRNQGNFEFEAEVIGPFPKREFEMEHRGGPPEDRPMMEPFDD